ncbi:hypothetical protein F2Q68_00001710 [Brassica cretica]|uniref:Uncharacterized protein n=1 Tax=Brassica cretica TaxID=69181 RepID=A0A8S9JI24_BRACR|nr:hypothetical protein F2Q68_00001710 [Brassica cretica]
MHMGDDGRALVSTTHTGASTSHAMPQPSHEDAFIRKSDIEALIKALNANSVHPDPEGDNEQESTPETPEDDSASVHDQDGAESGDQYDADQGQEEAVSSMRKERDEIRPLILRILKLLRQCKRLQFESAWRQYQDDPNLSTVVEYIM